jgi:hypothetical protein
MLTTLPLPYLTRLILPVLFALTLSACQPSERPVVPDVSPVHKTAKVEVDLNDLCNNLSHEMQQVDHQRTLLALQQINQDLKVCLPLMTTQEQLKLLDISHQMYERFLVVERTPTQQNAFEQYVNGAGTHPTLQQQYFEQMTLRDQYLVKHQGQSYVELIALNDSYVGYRRSPQYLARIFAPYLPEAEQNFIQALANQNTQPLFNNQSLKIEPLIVAERALFWENYLSTYPQSRYKADAQYLYRAYSQLLFTGTQHNKVSDHYSGIYSIDPQSLTAIQYVSQQSNTKLADQALKFLAFIQQDSKFSHMNLEQEHQAAVSAIENELGLVPVSFKRSKNCFLDAVCI